MFADRWPRFDHYEVSRGYIRPAPGASLTWFEPWKEFGTPEGKEGIQQPYHSLMELSRDLRFDEQSLELANESAQRLTNWCGRFGLLGLLLHRVETVILPVEKRRHALIKSNAPIPMYTKFTRSNTGWKVLDLIDTPLTSESPGVYLRKRPDAYELTFEPLSQTWASFFPNVPADQRNDYQYPTPYTDEFWREYCEPVSLFFRATKDFCSSVDTLRQKRVRQSEDEIRAYMRARDTIHVLSAPVRPMLYEARNNRYSLGWASHSLLAAFAMMAMQDLSRVRILECGNPSCRKIFISKARKARYCSPTCRGTVQMRKYRRRLERKSK